MREKSVKAIGAILIILSLVIGIVPLFSDCASQGRAIELANGRTIPMKCHWTGRAEIAIAIPLAVAGILIIISRRRETLRALSALGVTLGAMAVLLPTSLIGVCTNPDMVCSMLMKPALLFAGALTVATSVVGLVYLRGEAPAAIGGAGVEPAA
jgi:hypothetical protein